MDKLNSSSRCSIEEIRRRFSRYLRGGKPSPSKENIRLPQDVPIQIYITTIPTGSVLSTNPVSFIRGPLTRATLLSGTDLASIYAVSIAAYLPRAPKGRSWSTLVFPISSSTARLSRSSNFRDCLPEVLCITTAISPNQTKNSKRKQIRSKLCDHCAGFNPLTSCFHKAQTYCPNTTSNCGNTTTEPLLI